LRARRRRGADRVERLLLANAHDHVFSDGTRRDNRSRRLRLQSAATGIAARQRLISLKTHEADQDIL
jgi:hypothetical protein